MTTIVKRMCRDPRHAAPFPYDVLEPLDQIVAAAEEHGRESAPDHEVGDLQDALRLAWEKLTPAARAEVHAAYFETHDHWDEQT